MEEKTLTYYIGFFKFEDTTVWQKTNLYKEKDLKKLEEYLNNLQYCSKNTIRIKAIQLPE